MEPAEGRTRADRRRMKAHARHYSVEQANARARRRVEERIDRLRGARPAERRGGARGAVRGGAPEWRRDGRGRLVSEAFLELRAALRELQAAEIVLRDLDRGLVDFPALRDGREVYLCWVEGEDEIGYWHDLEAGFAGREPL